MKKIFTISSMMLLAIVINGQHGYVYADYQDEYNYYGEYNDDFRNDRRRERDRKRYRSRVPFEYLSYRDQKRVRKLERKLRKTERRAWDDGFLDRRERRCLDDIYNDIDRIYAKYRRNRRNIDRYYRNSYGGVCR